MDELKIIDRNIINKDITFYDITRNGILRYNYEQLSDIIDKIKSYLSSNYNIKQGETVLIGYEETCIYKIACFFACLELGLSITIIDYHAGGVPGHRFKSFDKNKSRNYYVDTKTKLLSPINYFICGKDPTPYGPEDLLNFFCNYCLNTVYHNDILNHNNSDKTNLTSVTDSKLVAMRCTSSGTTGTPKLIEHSHEFLFDICQRNSNMFYGNVVNEKCLGHGSGPATYFIPTLMSKDVKNIFNINFDIDEFYPNQYPIRNKNIFDHIMIPYTHDIDIYLNDIDENYPPSNTTIYTLSTIKKEWIPFVKENKIKNIISLFGSSETSGPIFINQAKDDNFIQNKFNLVDDYYQISFTEKNLLEVFVPIYNKKICTNDEFSVNCNNFYHNGRRDLIRINGTSVNIKKCDEILKQLNSILDAKFIYDTAVNEIYLAVWKEVQNLDILVEQINNKMLEFSWSCHYISKYEVLDYKSFFSGIKIDNQLLRDYFRENVEKKYTPPRGK
jgi:hypothetical protein